MRKIILLSLISLISFAFESLAMEIDLEKEEISPKRKRDVAIQQDQGDEESTLYNSPTKKFKGENTINNTANNTNYQAYTLVLELELEEEEVVEEKKNLPSVNFNAFKVPVGRPPKRLDRRNDQEKDACPSDNNIKKPLLTRTESFANLPMPNELLFSIEQKEPAQKKRLPNTRGTTFYLPLGSTWEDLLRLVR